MIRKRHIVYWALSIGSLALLGFEAPRGMLLTSAPDRGQVERAVGSTTGTGPSIRGPGFIWAVGGYHGGK